MKRKEKAMCLTPFVCMKETGDVFLRHCSLLTVALETCFTQLLNCKHHTLQPICAHLQTQSPHPEFALSNIALKSSIQKKA